MTRVGARPRSVITKIRHRAVHAGVEHAALVHADGVGHVVDALVPGVLDHVVSGRVVVEGQRAVRRSLDSHNGVVMVLVEVRDVRCVLFVLFARFRIVLFLLSLPLPLHADRHGDAANRNEGHGDGQNGDERDLAAAEIVAAASDLGLLIARRRGLIHRFVAINSLKAVRTLTLVGIDAIEARCAVFAWR